MWEPEASAAGEEVSPSEASPRPRPPRARTRPVATETLTAADTKAKNASSSPAETSERPSVPPSSLTPANPPAVPERDRHARSSIWGEESSSSGSSGGGGSDRESSPPLPPTAPVPPQAAASSSAAFAAATATAAATTDGRRMTATESEELAFITLVTQALVPLNRRVAAGAAANGAGTLSAIVSAVAGLGGVTEGRTRAAAAAVEREAANTTLAGEKSTSAKLFCRMLADAILHPRFERAVDSALSPTTPPPWSGLVAPSTVKPRGRPPKHRPPNPPAAGPVARPAPVRRERQPPPPPPPRPPSAAVRLAPRVATNGSEGAPAGAVVTTKQVRSPSEPVYWGHAKVAEFLRVYPAGVRTTLDNWRVANLNNLYPSPEDKRALANSADVIMSVVNDFLTLLRTLAAEALEQLYPAQFSQLEAYAAHTIGYPEAPVVAGLAARCRLSEQAVQNYFWTKRRLWLQNQTRQEKALTRGVLEDWFSANYENPFPSNEVKLDLVKRSGLTMRQVNNFFGNKRSRMKRRVVAQRSVVVDRMPPSAKWQSRVLTELPAEATAEAVHRAQRFAPAAGAQAAARALQEKRHRRATAGASDAPATVLERWFLLNRDTGALGPETLQDLAKRSGLSVQQVDKSIADMREREMARRATPKGKNAELELWFANHLDDPYPSNEEKKELAERAGITVRQVNTFFGNKRMRLKRKAECAPPVGGLAPTNKWRRFVLGED